MSQTFLILVGFLVIAGTAAAIFLFKKSRTDEKQTDAIRDLERRLTDLMLGQSRSVSDQVHSFTKEATQIREELKQVQTAVKDVSSFQDIFKSPKLRGQWGEASLEHILAQYFPQELYKIQHLFSSGE